MKPDGWILMVVSWILILGLTAFTFRKVFQKKKMR